MSCGRSSWDESIKEALDLSDEWEHHAHTCTETPEQEILCRRIALHWESVVLHIEAAQEATNRYHEV